MEWFLDFQFCIRRCTMLKPFWHWLRGHRERTSLLKKPPHFKPWMDALEERYCPAHGTQFMWDPPTNYTDLNFSDKYDWFGQQVPGPFDTAVFDGHATPTSNLMCFVDTSQTIGGLVFMDGYSSTLEIGAGNTLSAAGSDLTNLDPVTNTNTPANMAFDQNTSTLSLREGSNNNWVNFNLVGQNGQVQLAAGGTLNLQFNRTSRTNASFVIGGTFNVAPGNALAPAQFRNNAGITISAGGVMNLSQRGQVLNDVGDGGIITNSGTVGITAAQGTTITVSMRFLTHGTVNVGGGGIVAFDSGQFLPNGGGFLMDNGTLNLSQGVTLSQDSTGYVQTGGTLSVMDKTLCHLSSQSPNNPGLINGGVVQFTSGTGYGTLELDGDWNWNGGTLTVRINGPQGQSGQIANSDQIIVAGDLTIAATGPTLNVLVQGQLAQGQTWNIIKSPVNRIFPNYALQNPLQKLDAVNDYLVLIS
jgi:hypothetical protein